jgi:hypothetical protein
MWRHLQSSHRTTVSCELLIGVSTKGMALRCPTIALQLWVYTCTVHGGLWYHCSVGSSLIFQSDLRIPRCVRTSPTLWKLVHFSNVLVPEGQAGTAREPSKQEYCSVSSRPLKEKSATIPPFSILFVAVTFHLNSILSTLMSKFLWSTIKPLVLRVHFLTLYLLHFPTIHPLSNVSPSGGTASGSSKQGPFLFHLLFKMKHLPLVLSLPFSSLSFTVSLCSRSSHSQLLYKLS